MKNRFPFLLVLLACAFAAAPAAAHGYKAKTLHIKHPWTPEQTRPSDGRALDAVIHMEIANTGAKSDQLMRAESKAAHQAVIVGAANAGLRAGKIQIRAGQTIVLNEKGAHILLKGMKQALTPYNNFSVSLFFEKAGKIEVEIVVEDAPGQ
jgi:hypothetical protein